MLWKTSRKTRDRGAFTHLEPDYVHLWRARSQKNFIYQSARSSERLSGSVFAMEAEVDGVFLMALRHPSLWICA
jgi:hypothetical protein